MAAPSNKTLVETFLKMRDARTALKREFDEKDGKIKAQMERIEAHLLKVLNDSQTESMATTVGTFYRQEETIPTCGDWEKFYKWIKKNDAFDALEKRVKKTFVKEFMESNGGEVPPGISVFKEFVVRVRRN